MMNGSYRVNAPGAATLADARELRVNGSPVTVEVHDGAATVFVGTEVIFDGSLPADAETPADVFAWAAQTALNTVKAHRYGDPCKHCGQSAYDYNTPTCSDCRRTAERNGTDRLSQLYTPGKAAVLAELRTADVEAYDASHAAYVAAQDAQRATADGRPESREAADVAWAEYFRLNDAWRALAPDDASDAATPIVLDVQGSGYEPVAFRVRFATEDQALTYMDAHAEYYYAEVEDCQVPNACKRLLDRLYPRCEHGMSLDLCYGPSHYASDEEIRQGW